MKSRIRDIILRLRKGSRDESGVVFILVLVFLLVASLIVVPFLGFIKTGLNTGILYEIKTRNLYATDAGIEDGIWEIKYNEMQSFSNYDPLAFYDYDQNYEWSYTTDEEINSKFVDVAIQNIWVPSNISPPSLSQATSIVDSGKLVVNGTCDAENNSYLISLKFTPETCEEKDNLRVDSIGVYLPPGYQYVVGSSNLEQDPLALWYSVPTVTDYGSGQVIIWSDFNGLTYIDLPPLGSTVTATVTFDYVATSDADLKAVSWLKTSGVPEIPFAWDLATRVYHIRATSGGDVIGSYIMLPEGENLDIFGGALVADGDISLKKDSAVSGDIIYEGDFTYQEPFTHTDGDMLNDQVEFPSQEDNEAFADGIRQDAQALNFWGGDYDIGQGNGVDVTNLGPIYINGNLHVDKNNIINFTGPVFVEGSIDMDMDAEFTGTGVIIAVGDIYLAKTNDFGGSQDTLLMSLEGSITFKKEVEISGMIYAPVGSIIFDKSGVVNGSVIADSIQADKDGTFTQNYAFYDGLQLPGYTPGVLRVLNWGINQ